MKHKTTKRFCQSPSGNEETFPEATLTNQLEKFTEETRELERVDNQDISELADMFIVACGISRF